MGINGITLADALPFILAALALGAGLVSLRLGISVAVIEMILGVAAGNLGVPVLPWATYLAGLGGLILAFLAGAELDPADLRSDLKNSALLGSASFALPLIAGFAVARLLGDWSLQASLLAGIALSSTSIAVVYAALVEFGLTGTQTGKRLMSATFVTNLWTAAALAIVALRPTLFSSVAIVLTIAAVALAPMLTKALLRTRALIGRVIQVEIRFLLVLLLGLGLLAKVAGLQAVLPVFVVGALLAAALRDGGVGSAVRERLTVVSYAIITPFFFLVSGMKLSVAAVIAGAGLFAAFLLAKVGSKYLASTLLSKGFPAGERRYASLILSTGLTFGVIATLFGLDSGYLDDSQYAVLTAAIVASAIVPTFVAQRWFAPRGEEEGEEESA